MRVLFLLLLFAPAAVMAQSDPGLLIEQAGLSVSPFSNAAGAFQAELLRSLVPSSAGTEANMAVVEQTGSDNTIELAQQGIGNRFVLRQFGDGLTASFLQTGADNDMALSLAGLGNTITGAQIGDRNTYTLSLEASGTQHELLQFGNDLQATQVVAAGMLPASIEQRGDGMSVVVVRR